MTLTDDDLDALLGPIGPDPWWSKARRLWLRYNPRELRREVRWGIQRWRRGYSDRDVWNLDNHLATIIPPMMRQLGHELHGVPGTLAMAFEVETHEERMELATAEWRRILEAVAVGFESWPNLDEADPGSERYDELVRNWETGTALFIEHFGGFWD